MYSFTGRLNTIAFNTLVFLAILSALNYLSVYFDRKQPIVLKTFEIKDFETFVNDRYINEDALSFSFDFQVDIRPLYNWNTNLIFASINCEYNTSKSDFNRVTIWDQRVMRDEPETHIIKINNEFHEYYLTDYNKALIDVDVKCYFVWEQMPIVGANYGSRIEIIEFRTPKNYIKGSRRKYRPGPEKGQKTNY